MSSGAYICHRVPRPSDVDLDRKFESTGNRKNFENTEECTECSAEKPYRWYVTNKKNEDVTVKLTKIYSNEPTKKETLEIKLGAYQQKALGCGPKKALNQRKEDTSCPVEISYYISDHTSPLECAANPNRKPNSEWQFVKVATPKPEPEWQFVKVTTPKPKLECMKECFGGDYPSQRCSVIKSNVEVKGYDEGIDWLVGKINTEEFISKRDLMVEFNVAGEDPCGRTDIFLRGHTFSNSGQACVMHTTFNFVDMRLDIDVDLPEFLHGKLINNGTLLLFEQREYSPKVRASNENLNKMLGGAIEAVERKDDNTLVITTESGCLEYKAWR